MPNRLSRETSPYLLQHQHNPVDWYPWDEEAFEKARAEMKLVFLSIGYSACHWCHVMERESFESEEIAAVLNEHFVSIKVDREERPDVDGLYMEVVQQATGRGGWPLSVFLLPDGRPVYGGTYFPPEDRYGMPGFKRVLDMLAQLWKDEPERLTESATGLSRSLGTDLMAAAVPEDVTSKQIEQAVQVLTRDFDAEHGGFGSAPKFPQAMTLSFLFHAYAQAGHEQARNVALHTLDKMAQGGIYDHLGGGFHRYATDAAWLVPHFEKMLYDNALLVRAYLQAFQLTGSDRYRRVAEETIAYVSREMTSPEGGFYTAQDADSEGEEGKFFVWQLEEMQDLLGEKTARRLAAFYDVSREGNWEGQNILHVSRSAGEVAASLDVSEAELDLALQEGREALFQAREKRIRPGLDDKVLTAWNAMMATSLVEAYQVVRNPVYLAAAERNARFLLENLYQAETGVLMRSYKEGRTRYEGFVEDYAYLAECLIALFEATGEKTWLTQARTLTEQMIARFWDEQEGGFFFTHAETELIARRKDLMDNAMPSGNSVAVHVLQRLAFLLGEAEMDRMARHVLSRLAPMMRQYPSAFGYLLQALAFSVGPVHEVAIVGPQPEPFLKVFYRRLLPAKVVTLSATGADPEIPLLQDKTMVGETTTAYLCHGYACQTPVTDPEAFARQLSVENRG